MTSRDSSWIFLNSPTIKIIPQIQRTIPQYKVDNTSIQGGITPQYKVDNTSIQGGMIPQYKVDNTSIKGGKIPQYKVDNT